MGNHVKVHQHHRSVSVEIPYPDMKYIRQFLRLRCMPELHALFSQCRDEPKEITESYAAVLKMQQWSDTPGVVFNVGDGAHARTAAMFALLTRHFSFSIDPALEKSDVAREWADAHQIRRFELIDRKVEDISLDDWFRLLHTANEVLARGFLQYIPVLFTFVHAHVDVDRVLANYPFPWVAAYTSACCNHEQQLTQQYKVIEEGDDWAILSPERRYQVFTP